MARKVDEYGIVHHRRLLIKPGITGLRQVRGHVESSPDETIRFDLRCLKIWSFAGNVAIISQTGGLVLSPVGAF